MLIYQISWNFIQWDSSCFMRTDGRTHRRIKKLTGAFRNVANAPKKGPAIWCKHMKWVTEAGTNLTFLCDLVFQNYMSEVLYTRAREL